MEYNIQTQPKEKQEAPVTYNTALAIARIWAKKVKSNKHEAQRRIAAHLWHLGKDGKLSQKDAQPLFSKKTTPVKYRKAIDAYLKESILSPTKW